MKKNYWVTWVEFCHSDRPVTLFLQVLKFLLNLILFNWVQDATNLFIVVVVCFNLLNVVSLKRWLNRLNYNLKIFIFLLSLKWMCSNVQLYHFLCHFKCIQFLQWWNHISNFHFVGLNFDKKLNLILVKNQLILVGLVEKCFF